MERLSIAAAALFAVVVLWADGYAASSQHLKSGSVDVPAGVIADPSAPKPSENVWYPKITPRADGEQTYCSLWAHKAVYGVAAYVNATPEERESSFVITYQTGEQDKANPENFKSVAMDDGSHATIIVVTDGYDRNGHWYLTKDVLVWVERVMTYGWKWASANPVDQERAGLGYWIKQLHAVCMKDATA